MKTPFLTSLVIIASLTTTSADIVPFDAKTPLFELYEMQLLPRKSSDPDTLQMKFGKLLLSVHTLHDLRLLPDGSGVQATLNTKDARTFARLTHTLDYMILLCGDQKSSSTMHITGPIDDGVITFTDANYAKHVGGYLLRRCRKSSNQSPQRTAGRSDASHYIMKPLPLQSELAPTSGR